MAWRPHWAPTSWPRQRRLSWRAAALRLQEGVGRQQAPHKDNDKEHGGLVAQKRPNWATCQLLPRLTPKLVIPAAPNATSYCTSRISLLDLWDAEHKPTRTGRTTR